AALAERRDLVSRVDSLGTRGRVLEEDGVLTLRPFLGEGPFDPLSLRRLRARAAAEGESLRTVLAANGRALLVEAELRPDAAPAQVHALLESLRGRFDHPPRISFAASASAARRHALELAARGDLSRVTPTALCVLAALLLLVAGSV